MHQSHFTEARSNKDCKSLFPSFVQMGMTTGGMEREFPQHAPLWNAFLRPFWKCKHFLTIRVFQRGRFTSVFQCQECGWGTRMQARTLLEALWGCKRATAQQQGCFLLICAKRNTRSAVSLNVAERPQAASCHLPNTTTSGRFTTGRRETRSASCNIMAGLGCDQWCSGEPYPRRVSRDAGAAGPGFLLARDTGFLTSSFIQM